MATIRRSAHLQQSEQNQEQQPFVHVALDVVEEYPSEEASSTESSNSEEQFSSKSQDDGSNSLSEADHASFGIALSYDSHSNDSLIPKPKPTELRPAKYKCEWFTKRIPPLAVWCIALYAFCGSAFSIATVSFIAWYTDMPWVFPSLGATAFLHFAIPDQPPASPRNTICGHLLGGLMGYIGLFISGLQDDPVVFVRAENRIVTERIGCLCFTISTTCFFMILFNISHPPAGATTIIVALGILRTIPDLCVLMGSVLILCLQTWIITKIFRKDMHYPFWTNMTKQQRDATQIEDDPRVFVSNQNRMEESQFSRFQRQLTSRLVLSPRFTPRTNHTFAPK